MVTGAQTFPGRNLVDALVLAARSATDVLGYYLLVLLGLFDRRFSLSHVRNSSDVHGDGAIIAATIHALPLVTKSLRAAFEGVKQN